MKKELFASVLTITAGMASTIAFSQTALARSTVIEQQFAKNFRLKTQQPARFKKEDGTFVMGFIYLSLEQTPFTPEFQNQLRGEMTGRLYFESDDFTEEFNGKKYKTTIYLAGDTDVLLDLVHKDKESSNYQIYGCNSTMTECSVEKYQLFIRDQKTITIDMNLEGQNIEVLRTYTNESYWLSDAYGIPMVETLP